ncbi:MAG: anti-sigma factor antagonist [Acidobacteria bacterium]|nr:MAG: anti-sigma factor antagonist [Acidobacteriota bacterium]
MSIPCAEMFSVWHRVWLVPHESWTLRREMARISKRGGTSSRRRSSWTSSSSSSAAESTRLAPLPTSGAASGSASGDARRTTAESRQGEAFARTASRNCPTAMSGSGQAATMASNGRNEIDSSATPPLSEKSAAKPFFFNILEIFSNTFGSTPTTSALRATASMATCLPVPAGFPTHPASGVWRPASLLPSGRRSKSRAGAARPARAPGGATGYNHAMRADVRQAKDVVIVDFKGDLLTEDGEEVLREVVAELIAEGWTKILLNLARVKRLDSGGVGELVATWKLAHELGAALKLLRPGDRVKHTLHLSQILPLLEVFEDEPAAVASFSPA